MADEDNRPLAERAAEAVREKADADRMIASVERDTLAEIERLMETHDVKGFFDNLLPLVQALPEGRARQQGMNFATLLANAPKACAQERRRREVELNPDPPQAAEEQGRPLPDFVATPSPRDVADGGAREGKQ